MNQLMKWFGLAMAVAVLSAPIGEARGRDGGGRGGRGGHFKRMMEELNLSKEQKEKLAAARKSNRESGKALREQMKAAKQKLDQAMEGDASSDELRKLHSEMSALRMKSSQQRFERVLAIREILTPEQRKKFQEIKGKRKGHRGRRGRGGRGRGHRGPRGGGDMDDDGGPEGPGPGDDF